MVTHPSRWRCRHLAVLVASITAGCGSDEDAILGTYSFDPSGPTAPYTVTAEYVHHSSNAQPAAGPNCVEVVYDVEGSSGSSLGFGFYRNLPGFTTCSNEFNSVVNGSHTSTALQFDMVGGSWTGTSTLHAVGTYTAATPPNPAVVESGTFVFDIPINPNDP